MMQWIGVVEFLGISLPTLLTRTQKAVRSTCSEKGIELPEPESSRDDEDQQPVLREALSSSRARNLNNLYGSTRPCYYSLVSV